MILFSTVSILLELSFFHQSKSCIFQSNVDPYPERTTEYQEPSFDNPIYHTANPVTGEPMAQISEVKVEVGGSQPAAESQYAADASADSKVEL